MKNNLTTIKLTMTEGIKSAEARIAALCDQLKTDAAHALGWSSEEFVAAARLQVYKGVLASIEAQKTKTEVEIMTNLARYALDTVLRSARYPKQSTSPVSNYMDQQLCAIWAEFLAMITGEV